MKSSLTLIVLLLVLINILAGCAAGPNEYKGTAKRTQHGRGLLAWALAGLYCSVRVCGLAVQLGAAMDQQKNRRQRAA